MKKLYIDQRNFLKKWHKLKEEDRLTNKFVDYYFFCIDGLNLLEYLSIKVMEYIQIIKFNKINNAILIPKLKQNI